MRTIKLTGREATVIRAIGFTDVMIGAEIQEYTRMDVEDVVDTLNGLLSAGYIESVPSVEQVEIATVPETSFEVNPAYVQGLKSAMTRR